jgi:hypothetical protein
VVQVSVHAIPVFDGQLVQNEISLHTMFDLDALKSTGSLPVNKRFGSTVALLNEYDIPWVELAGVRYPTYRTTLKIKRQKAGGAEQDEDDDSSSVDDDEDGDDNDAGESESDSEMASER